MRTNWPSGTGFSRSCASRVDRRVLAIALLCVAGCDLGKRDRPVFKLLSPEATGVAFANTITTDDTLNVQTDTYVYNGAGVAVGDIDNDGLPDIFFSGNMVTSRLYRNKGGMRFEDVTEKAGVKTTRWATGATMVDINDDGYLDIYVAVSGPEWSKGENRANLLFVNNRNGSFTEEAAKYAVADTGFTTYGTFLDYNKDGCLDLFLLNNSPKDFSRGVASLPTGMSATTPGSYNELYRNDCPGGKPGKFTNVSGEAGILREAGYGLGVVVSDLNADGWPDIYVSNDGVPNDVIYVNNRDGTFTNKAASWLKHGSAAGMGIDIADFNNDGRPDIVQADMMPRDLEHRKRTNGFQTHSGTTDALRRGFRQDYSENSLQLNNGVGSDGGPVFSEIARLAGVSQTDWSWSALFADFDNDGLKDIFIGNGYPKAVNDLDYMTSAASALQRRDTTRARALLKDLPGYKASSFIYRNKGDLTFADETKQWGIDQPAYSYGAAYADLNNDGKLDLVVNNMNGPAFIYQNVLGDDEAHHYLQVRLVGDSAREKTGGIGATLILTAGGVKQYIYSTPFRGFMSTMDGRAHFGLGRSRTVDSLDIQWPDGRRQVLTKVAADRELIVKQSDAQKPAGSPGAGDAGRRSEWFQRITPKGLAYRQPAFVATDFSVQPLLPYLISAHGPALAVGDVNGDHLDDVFIGGGGGVAGRLLIQQKNGSFVEATQSAPWAVDKQFEDWGAAFFDANGDGLPDLYVASGGYQVAPTSRFLQDRLYMNRGGGRFVRDSSALPAMLTSTSAVRVGDFNGDGRPDLFVGGRLTPRKYPYPARSYILRNDGGKFTDVTDQICPDLVNPGGMSTDAAWIDFDGDGRLDLVTVGEWMPIQFYRNEGSRLRNVTSSMDLPPLRGWWYSLAAGDFDGDGKIDLIAGNLGLNYSYTASKDTTFGVYASNFTGNQTTDLVLTRKSRDSETPLAGMAPLGREIYPLGVKFPTYGSFASVSISQAFSSAQLQQALHYEADTFASMFLHNDGGGKFTATPLPVLAQIAPIKGIIAQDVDGDGHLDIVVAGNLYDAEPNTPRGDAGNGLWLRGDGNGHFTPVSPAESGLLAPLNVSGLALLTTPKGKALLVPNTGDSLQVFLIAKR